MEVRGPSMSVSVKPPALSKQGARFMLEHKLAL